MANFVSREDDNRRALQNARNYERALDQLYEARIETRLLQRILTFETIIINFSHGLDQIVNARLDPRVERRLLQNVVRLRTAIIHEYWTLYDRFRTDHNCRGILSEHAAGCLYNFEMILFNARLLPDGTPEPEQLHHREAPPRSRDTSRGRPQNVSNGSGPRSQNILRRSRSPRRFGG